MLSTQDAAGGAAVYGKVAVKQRGAAVLATAVAVLIVIGSALPESRRSALHSAGVLHPYFHVGTFAVIALLAAWSTRSPGVRVALCIGIVLLGCLTEVTEWHLYGSPMEWTDMVLDAMGAVAGTGLGALTVGSNGQQRLR